MLVLLTILINCMITGFKLKNMQHNLFVCKVRIGQEYKLSGCIEQSDAVNFTLNRLKNGTAKFLLKNDENYVMTSDKKIGIVMRQDRNKIYQRFQLVYVKHDEYILTSDKKCVTLLPKLNYVLSECNYHPDQLFSVVRQQNEQETGCSAVGNDIDDKLLSSSAEYFGHDEVEDFGSNPERNNIGSTSPVHRRSDPNVCDSEVGVLNPPTGQNNVLRGSQKIVYRPQSRTLSSYMIMIQIGLLFTFSDAVILKHANKDTYVCTKNIGGKNVISDCPDQGSATSWRMVTNSNGTALFTSKADSNVWDVAEEWRVEVKVQHGNDNQLFQIVYNKPDLFSVVNRQKCLTFESTKTHHMRSCTYNDDQLYEIVYDSDEQPVAKPIVQPQMYGEPTGFQDDNDILSRLEKLVYDNKEISKNLAQATSSFDKQRRSQHKHHKHHNYHGNDPNYYGNNNVNPCSCDLVDGDYMLK